MPELDFLLQAMPSIEAAITAYGLSVFNRAEDAAATGTVRLGQRILQRITGRHGGGGVEQAARNLAEAEPDEIEDATAALRLELRKLLKTDPELRGELVALLSAGSTTTTTTTATASGAGSVAVGGNVSGVVSVGDNVSIQHHSPRPDH